MARYEVGDTIYPYKDPEMYKAYEQTLAAVKKWQEAQADGYKTVVFYLTREYRFNYSRTFSILYKRTIEGKHPVTDTPEYKSHKINITEGRVRTADPEQIAFLDLHKGFVREEKRELSPMEKERKEVSELKKFKEQLEADIATIKDQLAEAKAIREVATRENDTSNIKGKKKDS